MKNYIKVSFRGTIYGPIEAPAPFYTVCRHLRVSPNAKPSLRSVQNPDLVIVDRNCLVPTGFYEMLALPNVKFEQHTEVESNFVVHHAVGKSIETQTERSSAMQSHDAQSNLPLGKSEMNTAMQGMLHLISTIPPRYTVSLLSNNRNTTKR